MHLYIESIIAEQQFKKSRKRIFLILDSQNKT